MTIHLRHVAAAVAALFTTSLQAATYKVETSPRAFEDRLPGNVTYRPVSIYFAIDVTGSMSGNLAAIQANVEVFADGLRARGFDLLLGGVGFRDELAADDMASLTADVDSFKAYIRTLSASGGGDGAEASLLAIQESLKRLAIEDTRPNALKVVLVIGDQPGHYGPSPRDCKPDALVASFNAIPLEEQPNYRLFYSVGTDPNAWDCGESIDGKVQMERVIAAIFPSSQPEDRGAYVSYPFTGDSLQEEVSRLIEQASPGNEWGNCYVSKAHLADSASATVYTWPESEIDSFHVRGEAVPLSTTITEDQFNTLGATAKVVSEYCCMELGFWEPDFRDHCISKQRKYIDVSITRAED